MHKVQKKGLVFNACYRFYKTTQKVILNKGITIKTILDTSVLLRKQKLKLSNKWKKFEFGYVTTFSFSL